MKGKLSIVGAGPGDPDLISVKGMKLIQKADVILYDALVAKDLLNYATPQCKLVYVGKRKGKKEFPQEEINKLLVFYAQRFEHVVRLKGGDPYVFGRGHEELAYAYGHKILVDVVPGISSAIAGPSSAGIPLTKRGTNESFWVITGMLSSGKMSNDIALAAKSSATVIILMGMTHLKKIASVFYDERSASEPVAVIQNATMPNQVTIIGTTDNIDSLVKENNIVNPAIIVIGQVVNQRNLLNMISDKTYSEKELVFSV